MLDIDKANSDEGTFASDKTIVENINKEVDPVYGVIYIPGENGPEYVSKHYNSGEVQKSDQINPDNKILCKSKKKNFSRVISLISAIIVLTVLVSSASAFLAAYYTKEFYEGQLTPNGTIAVDRGNPRPKEDHIAIDTAPPTYQIQDAKPGELMSMEQAIATVKDSVVEITTERVQSGFGSFSQYVVSGAGSGVIISSGGYIITNNHVIEGASNITVRLTNGKEYAAKLIGTDSKTDIAVISISLEEGESLTSAVIGRSENLLLGQTVIAIGNPLGKLGGTVSDGIISCLAREIAMQGSGTMTLLQTNAAVSPGNSGGGLFDLYGRLIGVVNAKSTGEGVEGISFAIPIDTAWSVASQLIDKGYVSGRPCLGVTVKQVQYGYSIFGESYYQLVVSEVGEDSNLKVNDIIYGIDNIETVTLTDISDILMSKNIGDKVIVTIRRENRFIDVEVILVEYVPAEINGGE